MKINLVYFEVLKTFEAAYILTKSKLVETVAVKAANFTFINDHNNFYNDFYKYSTFLLTPPTVKNTFHIVRTKRIFMIRNSR